MPRGQRTYNQGGNRRTFCMPCGKIVQGQKSRLKSSISLHQKVCPECADCDCSAAWKAPSSNPNLNCISGGNSGNNRNFDTANVSYLNSETGEEFQGTIPKVGGTIDTIRAAKDLAFQNCLSPSETNFRAAATESDYPANKKKKGKRRTGRKGRANPSSKVQGSWADSDVTIVEWSDTMRVLKSLTADLTAEELIETLTQ